MLGCLLRYLCMVVGLRGALRLGWARRGIGSDGGRPGKKSVIGRVPSRRWVVVLCFRRWEALCKRCSMSAVLRGE